MCIGRDFEIVEHNFRKHPNVEIKLPVRNDYRSSGYDFFNPETIILNPKERKVVYTDIKAYMQDEEELLIFPRSSLGVKGIMLSNTVGKIDASYFSNTSNDGNIGLLLWNTSSQVVCLNAGERICQGSFYKYLITKSDNPMNKERLGGFGSSGL